MKDDMERDGENRKSFRPKYKESQKRLLEILNNDEIVEARVIERDIWDNPLVLEFSDKIVELSNSEDGDAPCFKIFE